MTVRTISAWLSSIGAMLAAGAMSAGGAFAQDSFPIQGYGPMPWSASCPQGNCAARTWSPNLGTTGTIRSGVQRVFGTARPTYQVNPLPVRQLQMTVPSSNSESPFYEYREAPTRILTPPQRPLTTFKNDDSPFYP